MSYVPLNESSQPITPAFHEARADKIQIESSFSKVTCPENELLEMPFKKYDNKEKAKQEKNESQAFDKLFAAAPAVIVVSIAGSTGVSTLGLDSYRARNK